MWKVISQPADTSRHINTQALLDALQRPNLTNAERVQLQAAALAAGIAFDLVKRASYAGRAQSAGAAA